MPNFVVTSLPAYVENNRDLLIKNFALVGGTTRKRISIQTGIKKDEYINYLELTPVFADGSGCGWEGQGTANLTQRIISTARYKVNLPICPDTLIGKWGEYQVRINADENNGLPFEEYVMEALVNEIAKKIEKIIWQGVKKDDLIDGFLTVAAAETDVVSVSIAGTSDYADILAVYNKLSEDTLDRGAEIYVSPAKFRGFMQGMVTKNYYHYDPGNAELEEFPLPGSNCKVVRTTGLSGSDTILGTFAKNLVYGCDIENASEDIRMHYSEDNDEMRLTAKWNMGVNFAFPKEVVIGTKASV